MNLNQEKKAFFSPGRIIGFLLGVAILAFLIKQLDFKNLSLLLKEMDLKILTACTVVYLIKSLFRSIRFMRMGNIPLCKADRQLAIVMGSSLATQILPFRLGEFVYTYLAKKEGLLSIYRGLFSTFMVRILDVLAIGFLFLLSYIIWFAFFPASLSNAVIYIFLFTCLLIVFVAVLLMVHNRIPSFFDSFLNFKIIRQLHLHEILKIRYPSLITELNKLKNYRLVSENALLSLFEWLINFFFFYLLLLALNYPLNFYIIVIAVTFSAFASILPINSFGNFGTQEAGWTMGLLLLGIPEDWALTTGFATHLLSIVVMVFTGGLSLLYLHIFKPKNKNLTINCAHNNDCF